MAEQKVVLLVQDTTEIDLTRPEQEVAGAGELDGSRRGVLLHEMQAFTTEGTPLGTVWAEVLNRTEGVSHASAAEKATRSGNTRPSKRRRACVGSAGLRRGGRWPRNLPAVQCVCVADSEADIYEYVRRAARRSPGALADSVPARTGALEADRHRTCATRCWPRRCCTKWTCDPRTAGQDRGGRSRPPAEPRDPARRRWKSGPRR